MKPGIGVLFLGAAMMSIFTPAPRRAQSAALRSRRVESLAAILSEPAPIARMLALVQTRPHVLVLAISESREELEREMQELNETWNHWQLRSERQRYEIQPAPVLRPIHETNPRRLVAPLAPSV